MNLPPVAIKRSRLTLRTFGKHFLQVSSALYGTRHAPFCGGPPELDLESRRAHWRGLGLPSRDPGPSRHRHSRASVRLSPGAHADAGRTTTVAELMVTVVPARPGVRSLSHDVEPGDSVFDNLYTTVRCYRSSNCGCGHAAHYTGESISVAGACMSFGHASNGPNSDTD
jgi:hypothetical protein